MQSFESGSITRAGAHGRYTVTLDRGLGQTIYYSDRPNRIVGTTPTEQFIEELGFTPDNPPNAAIVTDNGDGESTLAVIELFDPIYDAETATMTYEVEVLEHWHDATDLGFSTTPVDLDAVGETFGAAHLFIDGIWDCPDEDMWCWNIDTQQYIGQIPNGDHDGFCRGGTLYRGHFPCFPCAPWYDDGDDVLIHWSAVCNQSFADCDGHCEALYIDSSGM